MSVSRLPPQPDFEQIEASAGATADQRATLMRLIGDLNFAWSNNESLLIYVIMLLLRTDETSAAIVFATLNTTRARADLIGRLASMRLRDQKMRKALQAAIDELLALTRIRNDINHSTFVVGPEGDITHTQTMKLNEKRGRLSFGERRAVDEVRLSELEGACARAKLLNRTLWQLLPEIERAAGD
jgi:hypothetical protein